jgi:hypothetical protein
MERRRSDRDGIRVDSTYSSSSAMLKDIKDNVYGEHVLPECKRVNRAIATVDDTIKVHAIVESNTSKWFCIVSGSRRIKRAWLPTIHNRYGDQGRAGIYDTPMSYDSI